MRKGTAVRIKRDEDTVVAVTVTPLFDSEAATGERVIDALEAEFGASEYEVIRE